MSVSKGILFAILLSLSMHVRAEDCLNNLPPSVRAAVEQDNWTILQPQDLAGTDPQRWKGNHPGECPGVASGNFYPKGKTSYLVALIQRNPTTQASEQTSQLEKLTLVYLKKDSPVIVSVIPPTQVAAPMVVWKLHRGSYQDLYGSKKVTISRESFVYEKLVGTANQFYYDGSHLKSLVLSK